MTVRAPVRTVITRLVLTRVLTLILGLIVTLVLARVVRVVVLVVMAVEVKSREEGGLSKRSGRVTECLTRACESEVVKVVDLEAGCEAGETRGHAVG